MERQEKKNRASLDEYSIEEIDKCLDFIRDRTPVSDEEGGFMMPGQKQKLEEHEEKIEQQKESIQQSKAEMETVKASVEQNRQQIQSISDVNGLTPMTEEELMLLLV